MKLLITLSSLALSALLLAGCGDDDNGDKADSAPHASITEEAPPVRSSVNPVDVLKKVADCVLASGVSMGEEDMNGNLYASCELEDLEYGEGDDAYVTSASVMVRAVDPATLAAQGYQDADVDDSTKVIFGDGFYLTVSATPEVFGEGVVDVEAIAAAVGGTVQ